jgi:hypothetical protein
MHLSDPRLIQLRAFAWSKRREAGMELPTAAYAYDKGDTGWDESECTFVPERTPSPASPSLSYKKVELEVRTSGGAGKRMQRFAQL